LFLRAQMTGIENDILYAIYYIFNAIFNIMKIIDNDFF
jgi:hypothetical protein